MAQKNVKTYLGKIQNIGRNLITVSLYDSGKTERFCTLPRDYFPQENLDAGQTFKYRTVHSIKMITPKDLSPLEVARIRGNIERRLSRD